MGSQKLTKSLYSRSGTGGQYQLIMSSWMLTRKSLHHGLNTNNTINQLYKILYVMTSCPTILHNMSFYLYKIRIEDFCLLTSIKALTEAHWLPKCSVISRVNRWFQVNHYWRLVDIFLVCSISFDPPANYIWATWHVFPPKYNVGKHFNKWIAAIYYYLVLLGKFRRSFVLECVPSRSS